MSLNKKFDDKETINKEESQQVDSLYFNKQNLKKAVEFMKDLNFLIRIG